MDVILSRLGLSHVLHLPIGGRLAGGSGLSGGERKRVSVGVSIATCPHAILLDEPSSGLDSYSAFELIRLLKTICTRTNRTVLVSLHQPSSQLFELFDGLVLLSKGRQLYHGPPLDAMPHIQSLGAPPPPHGIAPADHLLHVLVTHVGKLRTHLGGSQPQLRKVSVSSNSTTGATRLSMQSQVSSVAGSSADAAEECSLVLGVDNSRCGAGWCTALIAMPFAFARQTRWLGWRCVLQLSREPSLVRTQLVMHLLVALTLGALFLDVKSDIAGFQNKAGAISFTLYFFSIGGLSSAQTVTREWPLLWAEYHQGLYSAITYAITRLVLELFLLRVLPAIAYGGVFYSMMGLRRETGPFVRFLFGSALASADSALLCTAVSAFAPRHTGAAMLVSTVLMLGCLLLSGLNLNLDALPEGVRWLPDISFGKHAFEIMLSSELDGQMVLVDVPGAPPVRIRANVIIEKMGLSTTRYAEAFVALIGIGLVLMFVTAMIVALQMRPSFKYAPASAPILPTSFEHESLI